MVSRRWCCPPPRILDRAPTPRLLRLSALITAAAGLALVVVARPVIEVVFGPALPGPSTPSRCSSWPASRGCVEDRRRGRSSRAEPRRRAHQRMPRARRDGGRRPGRGSVVRIAGAALGSACGYASGSAGGLPPGRFGYGDRRRPPSGSTRSTSCSMRSRSFTRPWRPSIHPSPRITVITAHDRDWAEERTSGERDCRDRARSRVRSRPQDRSHRRERDQRSTRARQPRHGLRGTPLRSLATRAPNITAIRRLLLPDYFLIVDADEIYEAGTLERLRPMCRARSQAPLPGPCIRYFKRWNYRIDGYEWTIALGTRRPTLPYLRLRKPNLLRRGLRGCRGCRSSGVSDSSATSTSRPGSVSFITAATSGLARTYRSQTSDVSATRTRSSPTGWARVSDAWDA